MNHPSSAAIVCVALLVATLLTGCDQGPRRQVATQTVDPAAAAKAAWEAKRAVEDEVERSRCLGDKPGIFSKFEMEMKAKAYNRASLVVSRCARVTGDHEYGARLKNAENELEKEEVLGLVKTLTDRDAYATTKVPAYERLLQFKDKPAFAIAERHVKRYAKEYEHDRQIVSAARRDSVTPSIGWSRAQLTAMKGNPSDINRTVTTAGTREQWVYCLTASSSCTYVYLEGGVVTSFQD